MSQLLILLNKKLPQTVKKKKGWEKICTKYVTDISWQAKYINNSNKSIRKKRLTTKIKRVEDIK